MDICKFWIKGYCKFGEKCRNLHYYPDKNETQLINTDEEILIIDYKPVVIKGKWSDVEDDDPF